MSKKYSCPASFAELLSGADDPIGLLKDVRPSAPKAKAMSPAEQNFQEIVEFRERIGHEPSLDASDFLEKKLAARLRAYRTRPELKASVKSLDAFNLLEVKPTAQTPTKLAEAPKTFSSFADLLSNDASGLLGGIESSIFEMKNVQEQVPETHNLPDEIAFRKKCEDFYNFEKLFADIRRDIQNHQAKTERFKNSSLINIGDFFIVKGILCFVDSVVKESIDRHNRDNPRIRVIFDNGMETDILKLSLAKALYEDDNGRRVIPLNVNLEEEFAGISHKDKATGCIYILASETKAPELADLKQQGRLVKIGYSSQSVEERTKNAAVDPTYLEAPVRILASLDCFNLNPQKVEHLIHAFLSKQRINMTLISSKGKPYRPTEWFSVDLQPAIAVAEHIVAGDIMKYRMDNTTGRIKKI